MKKNEVGPIGVNAIHRRNCLFLAFAALAAFAGGTGGTALSQTVGWWGFEGDSGQTAAIGTVFSNRVDASRLSAEVYARYEGAASTDYQPVFDNPIFGPYGMGDSTTSFASRSTLKFTSLTADAGREQGCPVRIHDANGALDLQTFSLEGWFKMEPSTSGNSGWRAIYSKGYGIKDGGGAAYTYALYVEGFDNAYQTFKAKFTVDDGNGGVRHIEDQVFSGTSTLTPLRNGNWHYVSLVVNSEKKKANLFFDFNASGAPVWVGEIDLGGALVYNPDEPLVIGGSNLSGWQFCGSVDEVRLSDVVINTEPLSLRKRGIPDGTVIGHFPMEDDFNSTVWSNYWPNPALSAATGGETPSFANLEQKMVYCDRDGIRIGKEVDERCLTLDKGKVQWTAPELLLASADSLTVEFFMNANREENVNWAGIARTDYTANSTTFIPWSVNYTTDGNKEFACRVDTSSGNTSTTFATFPLLDGKWHHLALQIWRSSGNTTFAVYVDYEERLQNTVVGHIAYPTGTHFGFGLSGNPFVGRIDEVRITKGIIPVDDFMRLREPLGTMMIIY